MDALEADGFVARQPHPTDRRASLVVLTARGRRAAAGMHEDELRLADQLLGHRLPDDMGRLAEDVEDIVQRLREVTSAS